MYILGISCYYHDSAVTLLKDGKIIAAAEEERFTRKKHDNSFPINAISFCLEKEGLVIDDIDHIAFYEKPLIKFERVLFQCLETFPKSFKTFVAALPSWFTEKLRVRRVIRKKLKYKKDIIYVPHHLSHAAQFFHSDFNSAAIVTVDGVGEWTTTAWGVGENNFVELKQEIIFPHSLGLLYSAVTAFLGFSVNNSEYKVMGLSAYGNNDRATNEFYKKLINIVDVKSDGSFALDLKYFTYHYADHMFSKNFSELLGLEARVPESEVTNQHKDIAAAVQMVYEDVFFKILNHVQKVTNKTNLVLSGGGIQNSVANGKIFEKTNFENVFISPNTTDGGASSGAASFAYHVVLNNQRITSKDTAYLGPSFSDASIKKILEKNNLSFAEHDDESLCEAVADLLASDKVVGWFQGAIEFGPRALGNRSILANPKNPDAQKVLNEKIKHRETFRPFAPSVCAEDAEKYFDIPQPLPDPACFMSMVFPVKEEFKKILPAITHVNGTARVQTVNSEDNVLYYDLLRAFEKKSGVPMLINTSFNVRGEPIVCAPEDAIACFKKADIDVLVLGHYVVEKK